MAPKERADERFLCDVMLGGLARWLRLLGHDAAYDNRAGDPELLRRAAAEQRTLLTRDTRIVPPAGVRLVLVRDVGTAAQVREVAALFGLGWTAAFTRCVRCNVTLLAAGAGEVAEKVPDYVRATHTAFRSCPSCGRVYWAGTHRKAMVETLRRLLPGAGAR